MWWGDSNNPAKQVFSAKSPIRERFIALDTHTGYLGGVSGFGSPIFPGEVP